MQAKIWQILILQAIVRDLWTLRLQKLLERPKSSTSVAAGTAIPQDNTGGVDPHSADTTEYYTSEYWWSEMEVENAISKESDILRKILLKKSRRIFLMPGLITTIALCYLGSVMLRVPVSLGDFYKWMETQELPYYHALKEISPPMAVMLAPVYRRVLQPTVCEHVVGMNPPRTNASK